MQDIAEEIRRNEFRKIWGDQDPPPEVIRNAERVLDDPFWGLGGW